jgi:uncharacterized protein (TIGR02145 family)
VFEKNSTVYAHWRELVEPHGNSFYDSRDGRYYNYVKIGDLEWMAENVKFVTDDSRCAGNDITKCGTIGGQYSWAEATTVVCPVGWSLPRREEWMYLRSVVGDSLTAGKKLKSTESWNSPGTNEFGFSALNSLGGSSGTFAYWWSTEPDGSTGAYAWWVREADDVLGYGFWARTSRYPVRCYRDAGE